MMRSEEAARKCEMVQKNHTTLLTDGQDAPSFNARTLSPSLESVAFNTALKKLNFF
uniref:Uncharacterized protein n=1 Tax=Oryza brachyantha TaxID=4533 RepID=J3NEK1_ORYBR